MKEQKLTIIETFSGIGAQHKAITRLNKKYNKKIFDVIATCDWDINANISYDAIHKRKYNIPKISGAKKLNYLSKYQWSWDGSKPISDASLSSKPKEIINQLFNSVKGHKNFGSITQLDGHMICDEFNNGFDVLTYSFPCQNLSTAGAFHNVNKGMKKGDNTRSGLLWEIERILNDLKKLKKLPKYLLLENVKAMLFKKNIKEFKKWIKFLQKLGYSTNTQILDATKFGIPQKRERVFALSILNYNGPIDKEGQPNIKYKESKTKSLISFIKHNDKYLKEYIDATPNATPSRVRMRQDNPFLLDSKYTRTITTKQDRHPNCGTIKFENDLPNKSQYRFITPRESLMLMGFDKTDYDKIKKTNVRKELIYKQAGNSIVVNILESIFNWIKEYDEK